MQSKKACAFQGCSGKSVKRSTYCLEHTRSRHCQFAGCNKCSQGNTRFCISHGGGRRCTFQGCTKGARDKFLCAAHGGGKRCTVSGCVKSAVGGSKQCTAHGGGRRCGFPDCSKSAQSSTDFCVRHGGGRKCHSPGCEKVARGRTEFCAGHGGGVRCNVENCTRVVVGKFQTCGFHTIAFNWKGCKVPNCENQAASMCEFMCEGHLQMVMLPQDNFSGDTTSSSVTNSTGDYVFDLLGMDIGNQNMIGATNDVLFTCDCAFGSSCNSPQCTQQPVIPSISQHQLKPGNNNMVMQNSPFLPSVYDSQRIKQSYNNIHSNLIGHQGFAPELVLNGFQDVALHPPIQFSNLNSFKHKTQENFEPIDHPHNKFFMHDNRGSHIGHNSIQQQASMQYSNQFNFTCSQPPMPATQSKHHPGFHQQSHSSHMQQTPLQQVSISPEFLDTLQKIKLGILKISYQEEGVTAAGMT